MAGLVSLTSPRTQTLGFRGADAYIIPMDRDGVARDRTLAVLAFQWFPESVEYSSESGWSKSRVIGGNQSLVKWAGRETTPFTFSVVFSNDEELAQSRSVPGLATAAALQTLGTEFLAGADPLPPFVTTGDPERDRYSPDIRAAMTWLKFFTLGSYEADGTSRPPRELILVLENSGIGSAGEDHVRCVMDRVSFSITAWWPTGVPRYATAQMEITATPNRGSRIVFPDAKKLEYVLRESNPVYHIRPAR